MSEQTLSRKSVFSWATPKMLACALAWRGMWWPNLHFKYLEFQIISTLAFSSLQEKYVPPDQIFSVLVFRNHPEWRTCPKIFSSRPRKWPRTTFAFETDTIIFLIISQYPSLPEDKYWVIECPWDWWFLLMDSTNSSLMKYYVVVAD